MKLGRCLASSQHACSALVVVQSLLCLFCMLVSLTGRSRCVLLVLLTADCPVFVSPHGSCSMKLGRCLVSAQHACSALVVVQSLVCLFCMLVSFWKLRSRLLRFPPRRLAHVWINYCDPALQDTTEVAWRRCTCSKTRS